MSAPDPLDHARFVAEAVAASVLDYIDKVPVKLSQSQRHAIWNNVQRITVDHLLDTSNAADSASS